jgi:hypothetical protein
MIAAITTTAVFSVVLSSYVSNAKADKRDAAAMALRRAQDTLKSYVSAEPTNANMFPGVPGGPGSPVGRWSADNSGGWALAAGPHDISSLLNLGGVYQTVLNPTVAACSYGSSVCGFGYTVTDNNCGFGTGVNACKNVVFNLVYTD